MKKQKYWYMHYVGECPLCGKDASYKEKMVGKKPKPFNQRYKQLSFEECYCGCEP